VGPTKQTPVTPGLREAIVAPAGCARSAPRRIHEVLIVGALLLASVAGHAQDLSISELVATNARSAEDDVGDSPDWIEIHNAGASPQDLTGWFLTDDIEELRKWPFPGLEIGPGEFAIVFASGDDRAPPGSPPHTSFRLSRDGEYLALVRPDGSVAHEYSPVYPPQREDVSYGLSQDVIVTSLIPAGATARVLVPTDDSLENALERRWTEVDFDDATWTAAESGVGYDTGGDAEPPQEPAANLAPGGSASQSSTFVDGEASRAVDGDTSGDYSNGSVTHTVNEPGAWWQVDLGEDHPLDRVVLWNRTDCCMDRLSNFRLIVRNDADELEHSSDHFVDGSFPSRPDHEIVLEPGTRGRTVRISRLGPDRDGDHWLSLAEVEVLEAASGLRPFIGTDLQGDLFEQNSTAYLRIPFRIDDLDSVEFLELRMRYDDGFVAYLNGREVARRNAPESLGWDAAATTAQPAEGTFAFDSTNLTVHRDVLRSGDNVLAVHGLNVSPEDPDFLVLPELRGWSIESGPTRFFPEPTPGGPNDTPGVVGFVADTGFSRDRGFYDAPFEVTITTETPGATIRYTIDGSAPALDNGRPYTGPVQVESTTTLRAAAFKEAHGPTNVDTHTYIFPSDVVRQTGPGFPTSWGGAAADYEMDPDVVDDPAYRDTIEDDIVTTIPTLSIVMDGDDLFGPFGIYSNTAQRGQNWERPCSIEMIFPDDRAAGDDQDSEQLDCGIRIFGFGSRPHFATLKHSMRLLFKRRYGASRLRFEFFPGFEVESLDEVVLRAQNSRGWNDSTAEILRTQYIRDAWSRYTARDMGKLTTSSTYVNLYLNGLYWGLYNPVERPTAAFLEAHLGGDEDDYDALNARVGQIEVLDGSREAWDALVARAREGPTTLADYEAIAESLDVPDLADYMLINFYTGNRDWTGVNGNNMRVVGEPGAPVGGFKSFCWDMEYSIWNVTDNVLSVLTQHDTPATVHAFLTSNEEYRLAFADRAHKHLRGGGALTPLEAANRWMDRSLEINGAVVGESARWGDRRRERPYTRDIEWSAERDRLMTAYFPQRADILVDQLRQARLYTDLEPPTFNRNGGHIDPGFVLDMTAPAGRLLFTTDGSDPRLPGGEVAPQSREFGVGERTILLPARAAARWLVPQDESLGLEWTSTDFDDGNWAEGATGVGFDRGDDYADLISTDIREEMFQVNASVYIRLPFDVEDPSISGLLLRMKYDDGFAAYLNGARVAGSNTPRDLTWNSTATSSHADTLAVRFEDFDLSADAGALRAGRNLLAIHGLNRSRTNNDALFLPQLEAVEPPGKDGALIIDGTARVRSRAWRDGEWSALNEAVFITPGLRITEIMFHPEDPGEGSVFDAGDFEFLELKNVSDRPLDLGGIRLTGGVRFSFADATAGALAPGGVVVVVNDLPAFGSRYDVNEIIVAGEFAGNLSNGGEEIILEGVLGERISRFTFEDSWHPEADGGGYSLVVNNATGDPTAWGDETHWRRSRDVGGSPGVHEDGTAGWQLVGDLNQDGTVDISDPVSLLGLLFLAGDTPLPCGAGNPEDRGNVVLLDLNADHAVNLSDAIHVLSYLFRRGPPPVLGVDCQRVTECPDACAP